MFLLKKNDTLHVKYVLTKFERKRYITLITLANITVAFCGCATIAKITEAAKAFYINVICIYLTNAVLQ